MEAASCDISHCLALERSELLNADKTGPRCSEQSEDDVTEDAGGCRARLSGGRAAVLAALLLGCAAASTGALYIDSAEKAARLAELQFIAEKGDWGALGEDDLFDQYVYPQPADPLSRPLSATKSQRRTRATTTGHRTVP